MKETESKSSTSDDLEDGSFTDESVDAFDLDDSDNFSCHDIGLKSMQETPPPIRRSVRKSKNISPAKSNGLSVQSNISPLQSNGLSTKSNVSHLQKRRKNPDHLHSLQFNADAENEELPFGSGEKFERLEKHPSGNNELPVGSDEDFREFEKHSSCYKEASFNSDEDFEKLEYSLAERLRHRSDTFSEYLIFLIKKKGLTNADVYKKAVVDKKVFSKIKNNPSYHPTKITALCLCIGARLNLDETKDLLSRAGYALSPCDKTDIIFSYFIENEIYDMIELDIQLEEHGLPCMID